MFTFIFAAVVILAPTPVCRIVDKEFALCEVTQGDETTVKLCRWTIDHVDCGE